jgi:hypothetical protein
MTDGEAREMARELVRGSIIEDAASQFIAQILKHAHDERIKPLRDRIEALTEQLAAARDDAKEAEAYAEELEQDRRKTYEALLLVSRLHGEVEAKLAKAVGLALEECPFRHGTPKYDKWWHHRRATLAEIKAT